MIEVDNTAEVSLLTILLAGHSHQPVGDAIVVCFDTFTNQFSDWSRKALPLRAGPVVV